MTAMPSAEPGQSGPTAGAAHPIHSSAPSDPSPISSSSPASNPAISELGELVRACARDERWALEALYRATAPELYGLARAAAGAAEAEQALIRTYLEAFTEAARTDPATVPPARWLESLLDRHLPEGRRPPDAARPAALDPPAELWQRVDIALGLRRLDQHIKPGVATQERGRDPMPNHNDRRRDRRLAFWRGTAMTALCGLVLLLTLVAWPPLRQELTALLAGDPGQAAAEPSAFVGSQASTAILQPLGLRRVWRVDVAADRLLVSAEPAFRQAGGGFLTLWASGSEAGVMHRLGELDPAGTAVLSLPDELGSQPIAFAITLERAKAGTAPAGPVLFSGWLRR